MNTVFCIMVIQYIKYLKYKIDPSINTMSNVSTTHTQTHISLHVAFNYYVIIYDKRLNKIILLFGNFNLQWLT